MPSLAAAQEEQSGSRWWRKSAVSRAASLVGAGEELSVKTHCPNRSFALRMVLAYTGTVVRVVLHRDEPAEPTVAPEDTLRAAGICGKRQAAYQRPVDAAGGAQRERSFAGGVVPAGRALRGRAGVGRPAVGD